MKTTASKLSVEVRELFAEFTSVFGKPTRSTKAVNNTYVAKTWHKGDHYIELTFNKELDLPLHVVFTFRRGDVLHSGNRSADAAVVRKALRNYCKRVAAQLERDIKAHEKDRASMLKYLEPKTK